MDLGAMEKMRKYGEGKSFRENVRGKDQMVKKRERAKAL